MSLKYSCVAEELDFEQRDKEKLKESAGGSQLSRKTPLERVSDLFKILIKTLRL